MTGLAASLLWAALVGAPDLPLPSATATVTETATVPSKASFSSFSLTPTEPPSVKTKNPVMGRWWFWIVVGVLAASALTTGVLITQKEEFVPQGELGTTRTDRDWTPQ